MESSTGKVFVNKDIIFDRENTTEYFIKVKAIDGAPSARPQAGDKPNSREFEEQLC